MIVSLQSVYAIDKNQSVCDPICSQENVEKTIIIEKQDKQIADLNKTIVNFTNNESGNIFWRNVSIVISIITSIIAIIIKIDSWKKSNEIHRLRSKTEKAKTKSYNAKTDAEKARKNEHDSRTVRNWFDLFRGK